MGQNDKILVTDEGAFDLSHFRWDDHRFSDLLVKEKILVVQGTAFNWPEPDHFRIVFLPLEDQLKKAITSIGSFLETYSQ